MTTLQGNQNLGFTGTVNIVNLAIKKEARANIHAGNPVLRPLIKHLKHNCGSKDVHHTINIGDLHIGVNSSYKSAAKINGVDEFTREQIIIKKTPLEKKNITDLIEWSKGNKEWMKGIRAQEKEAVKNTPEPSFFKKLLNRFF